MSVTMEEKCSVEKSEQGCSYAEKVKLGQKQDQSTKDNNNAAMNGVEERDRSKGTWTLAGSLKRRKVTALVGAKKETGRLMGVERKARDTWDVYVGNLVDSVTETHVVEYTKRNGVEVRSCYMLKSKIYGTNSARIKVAIQDKDKILDSRFWPENVRVRSWVFKPR